MILQNFSCIRSPLNLDGVATEQLAVRWNGRQLTARVLTMGDQWDLLEIVGKGLDNAGWLSMAMIAACVLDVDGKPIVGDLSKARIRDTLNKLAPDGVEAMKQALATLAPPKEADEEAEKAAVGN